MTVWLAFLRAVNVGKRQMKMAELKALCEELGYGKVKTLLASGNVRFECAHDPKAELEAAIFRWIEIKYHRKWRKKALGRRTPLEFEKWHAEQAA